MSKRVVDVLILIPLIPALPILVTWFLPWERWVLDKIPGKILGPYILYGAFAGWYFGLPWWGVSIFALWGIIVLGLAIIQAEG